MDIVALWLDDIRTPPEGFLWAKTVQEAKDILTSRTVRIASLDHDLGACEACMQGRTVEEWLEEFSYVSIPNCSHVGTGYDLVLWMVETNTWPLEKPMVHSANPVGRDRMRGVIERYFGKEA